MRLFFRKRHTDRSQHCSSSRGAADWLRLGSDLNISVEVSEGRPLQISGCVFAAAGSLVDRGRVYHATGYFVNLDDIYLIIVENRLFGAIQILLWKASEGPD